MNVYIDWILLKQRKNLKKNKTKITHERTLLNLFGIVKIKIKMQYFILATT